jgi:hypothetical protein
MEAVRNAIVDSSDANLLLNLKQTEQDPTKTWAIVVNPDGNNITSDIHWDTITPTFAATTDTYEFYKDSVLVSTIVITYTDSTKDVLLSVTKN